MSKLVGELNLNFVPPKGGLKREFFQLISEQLFDLDTGLWMTCGENQMNLQVHPMSGK